MPQSPPHRAESPSVDLYDDEWEVITTQRFRIGPNGERLMEEKREYRGWINVSDFEDQEEAMRVWQYWNNEQRKNGGEQNGAPADSDDRRTSPDGQGSNAPNTRNLRLRVPVTLPSFSDSDSLSSSSHFAGSSSSSSYPKSSSSGSSSLPCPTASSALSSSSRVSPSSGDPSGSADAADRLHDSNTSSGIDPGRPTRRGRSVSGELKQ